MRLIYAWNFFLFGNITTKIKLFHSIDRVKIFKLCIKEVSHKVKYRIIIWPSNSSPRHKPMRTYVYTKNKYVDV